MRKGIKNALAFVIIGLLVFSAVGCSRQTTGSSVIEVKTAAADRHKLQTTMNVTGVLVPAQTININSKLSGQVIEMGFDVGSSVKAGDVLVRLETKALSAQLQQAEAGLESAQAAKQSVQSQADLAKINLDTAQKAYDRTKTLYAAGGASQSQLDDVSSKLDLARKQYENAAGSSLNQAQASIKTAQANINNIKVQMENAIIKSPINGIVVNRNINIGEIASPTLPLMAIADTSALKLKGTVSQEVLPLIKAEQEINVFVDIYPDKTYKGKIDSIGPMAVSTGVFFPIEISIQNGGDIKAGLSARASIDVVDEKGVVVPAAAVVQNNGESYVYVIKDNVAVKRIVTTGLKNDKEIEILKGLEAGERVAVTNANSLFDNMPVKAN
ncbi:MAG: efflux RND transporter periplasmic adaptor subunit [Caulobacteraceae bacterium]